MCFSTLTQRKNFNYAKILSWNLANISFADKSYKSPFWYWTVAQKLDFRWQKGKRQGCSSSYQYELSSNFNQIPSTFNHEKHHILSQVKITPDINNNINRILLLPLVSSGSACSLGLLCFAAIASTFERFRRLLPCNIDSLENLVFLRIIQGLSGSYRLAPMI